MNHRTIRRIGEIVVVLAMAFMVAVTSAQAASEASAKAKAAKLQNNDCSWGNPLFYKCQNAQLLPPACINTGVDQPGKPQHTCGGIFIRQSRLKGTLQACHTTYYLSPWNAELYGSGYDCIAAPWLDSADRSQR